MASIQLVEGHTLRRGAAKARTLLYLLMGVSLDTAGCSGVTVSTAVREPTLRSRTYTRVIVYGDFKSLAFRKQAEDELVSKLTSAGIQAAPSLAFFLDLDTLDSPAKAQIIDAGVDCILEVTVDRNSNPSPLRVAATARLLDLATSRVAWEDQFEANSITSFSADTTLLYGLDKLADDVVASGLSSKPAPKPKRKSDSVTLL